MDGKAIVVSVLKEQGVTTSVVLPDSEGEQLTMEQDLPIFGTNESSSSIFDVAVCITPEPTFSKDNSDCKIVGNKRQSLLEEESQHSKWEQFRRMAKEGSSHEECSQLLRKMERQDSDEEVGP